jgi:hypothetical protein
VVVDRIPRRRDLRLAGGERAVVGVEEAAARQLRRDAAVVDDHREDAAVTDGLARSDDELVSIARERRGPPVDRDAVDGHADEVEMEPREARVRLGRDRRDALQPVGGRGRT